MAAAQTRDICGGMHMYSAAHRRAQWTQGGTGRSIPNREGWGDIGGSFERIWRRPPDQDNCPHL